MTGRVRIPLITPPRQSGGSRHPTLHRSGEVKGALGYRGYYNFDLRNQNRHAGVGRLATRTRSFARSREFKLYSNTHPSTLRA